MTGAPDWDTVRDRVKKPRLINVTTTKRSKPCTGRVRVDGEGP